MTVRRRGKLTKTEWAEAQALLPRRRAQAQRMLNSRLVLDEPDEQLTQEQLVSFIKVHTEMYLKAKARFFGTPITEH